MEKKKEEENSPFNMSKHLQSALESNRKKKIENSFSEKRYNTQTQPTIKIIDILDGYINQVFSLSNGNICYLSEASRKSSTLHIIEPITLNSILKVKQDKYQYFYGCEVLYYSNTNNIYISFAYYGTIHYEIDIIKINDDKSLTEITKIKKIEGDIVKITSFNGTLLAFLDNCSVYRWEEKNFKSLDPINLNITELKDVYVAKTRDLLIITSEEELGFYDCNFNLIHKINIDCSYGFYEDLINDVIYVGGYMEIFQINLKDYSLNKSFKTKKYDMTEEELDESELNFVVDRYIKEPKDRFFYGEDIKGICKINNDYFISIGNISTICEPDTVFCLLDKDMKIIESYRILQGGSFGLCKANDSRVFISSLEGLYIIDIN